jgi:hypothetical protein
MENTAACNYWSAEGAKFSLYRPKLCSECDPEIGKWHGLFEKKSAKGLLVGSDGFLYDPESDAAGDNDWRKKHQGFKIIGKVEE